MKIAIFSDNFYPELSGISDSIIGLAQALAAKGHLINFYVPKYSAADYRTAKLEKFSDPAWSNNIKVTRFASLLFPGSGTKQARMVIPSFWRWRQVRRFQPDIIHTNHFFGVGWEALSAAKHLKVPLIGTNHTVISEFVRYSPIRFKKLSAWAERYVNWYYNHCALVTAPGSSLLTEMEKVGLRAPHQVVSNPLLDKEFVPVSAAEKAVLKKKFQLSAQTLVYAGRLAPEKNIEVLLRALPLIYEKYPEINLVLAGQGSSLLNLKNLAKDLQVENLVKFLGFLDKKTLAEVYNAAELFVSASTSEVQSMTILQAFSCGLPAIGARSRGLADCIKDKDLLFEPGNHQELARKVISFLGSQELQKRSVQEASAGVDNYSAAKIAEEWEKIYTRVVFTPKRKGD